MTIHVEVDLVVRPGHEAVERHREAQPTAIGCADDCRHLLADFRERFDALAEDVGAAERRRMASAFEASCHHEVRFWEMAWTLEDWVAPRSASSLSMGN